MTAMTEIPSVSVENFILLSVYKNAIVILSNICLFFLLTVIPGVYHVWVSEYFIYFSG